MCGEREWSMHEVRGPDLQGRRGWRVCLLRHGLGSVCLLKQGLGSGATGEDDWYWCRIGQGEAMGGFEEESHERGRWWQETT